MLSYTSIVTPNPGHAKNRGKTEAQNRPTHARRSRDSPDFVAPLLAALAESLDVPDIFARISAAARRTVPHDLLMLGLLREDPQGLLRRRSGLVRSQRPRQGLVTRAITRTSAPAARVDLARLRRLGYHFSWGDTLAGYRYLAYDFKDGQPLSDLRLGGPRVGVGVHL